MICGKGFNRSDAFAPAAAAARELAHIAISSAQLVYRTGTRDCETANRPSRSYSVFLKRAIDGMRKAALKASITTTLTHKACRVIPLRFE